VCIEDVTHDLVLHALFCLFLFLFYLIYLTTYIKYYFIVCLLHLLRIINHDNVLKLLMIIAVYDMMLLDYSTAILEIWEKRCKSKNEVCKCINKYWNRKNQKCIPKINGGKIFF